MPRIAGASSDEVGFVPRLIYRFARRDLSKVTGVAPDSMMEPIEIYGHVPALLKAYGRMEQATGGLNGMPHRYMALAAMKTATLVTCEYCIDLGSQIFRQLGLSDEELLDLPRYKTSPLFDETDRLVLDYAVGMTRTPADVPDDLFAALAERFSDAQMVELTHLIAMENFRGRFGIAFDVGSAGFSEGMVCALPVNVADIEDAGG